VFANLRIDLPDRSAAFLATLVLGIVLVLSPPPGQDAAPPELLWLMPTAAACLLGSAQPHRRGHR
jgi:hypothetical protein